MNTSIRLPIVALLASCAGLTAQAAPTWAQDVAPLIYKNCAECHRPGEVAPFSLLSYRDVQKRGELIVSVIEDRYMPPWHPEPGWGRMRDPKRLDDAQIATITRWVETGMERGDPAQEPEPPQFVEGWRLGEPDLVVEMPEAFEVPAGGPDIYRNFVVPLDLDEDKWVTAVEVRPSARSVVHHILFFLDDTGEARRRDARDPKPGYRGMGRRTGTLGGWAVGGGPKHLPDGLARALPKGSDLILSTHFHPSGKKESERTKIGLFFSDEKPQSTYTQFMIPPVYGALWGMDIPAGESRYRVTDSFTLPVDVKLVTVGGHAHYLCKSLQAVATLPDGTKTKLFRVGDWDFDWQASYQYDGGMVLPAGTKIDAEIVYDNSADNPNNQFDPPRRVRWGRESTDEMGAVIFGAVPVDEADLGALNRSYREQMRSGSRRLRGAMARGIRSRIERLDTDGDGVLVLEDVPERWRRAFGRLDDDGDGKVSVDDAVKALGGGR